MWKNSPSKTYKWGVYHIDDEDDADTKWFKTQVEAMWYIMSVSGYNIVNDKIS